MWFFTVGSFDLLHYIKKLKIMGINGWKRRSIIGIMGRRKNNQPRQYAEVDYFFWGPLFLYIDQVYHPLIHNLSFFNFIYPIQGQNQVLKKVEHYRYNALIFSCWLLWSFKKLKIMDIIGEPSEVNIGHIGPGEVQYVQY